ncbi:MAG: alpha/beta hydrolase [Proteobacteria bacterium]|nr:alpha/beta hydrolase [Pseudomonadota bacterium]
MNQKADVRLRRAYFDTRFGQLHVRTAFPGTGGFDEHTTLFCVHAAGATSRAFGAFLGLMAQNRSVYAPDRPGYGESDGGGAALDAQHHAQALTDLARDLRLRHIDVLGVEDGAAVAAALAADQPELVRRVVILAADPRAAAGALRQPLCTLRLGAAGTEFAADVFESAPQTLAKAVSSFLDRP